MSFSFSVRKKNQEKSHANFIMIWKPLKEAKAKAKRLYIYDLINEQKGFETSKKMLNDVNTLVHHIDANEMQSQRIKGLNASDLDHLCRFFFS